VSNPVGRPTPKYLTSIPIHGGGFTVRKRLRAVVAVPVAFFAAAAIILAGQGVASADEIEGGTICTARDGDGNCLERTYCLWDEYGNWWCEDGTSSD
jgi:hypothetical protein